MSYTEATLFRGKQDTRDPAVDLSPWCFSRLKRAMDFICALILIPAALPIMALIALAIKTTSRGPIFFRQKRLGKGGAEFALLKFRTMYHARREAGSGLTSRGDRRITAAGRLLRRCKLDELPQLFNVLRGEMSLVGPRPDLPRYFAGLDDKHRRVLSLTPGITGAASLKFRNEEALLAQVAQERLESFYVETLLPQKIVLDLEYARTASVTSDTALIIRTAAAIFQ
jgi:lipopolysaccharide/colanic/teichoic acid biosynthesis glycosyltransferase